MEILFFKEVAMWRTFITNLFWDRVYNARKWSVWAVVVLCCFRELHDLCVWNFFLFSFLFNLYLWCFSDVRSSIVGWSERFDVAQKLLSLLNSYTPKEVRQSCLGMSSFYFFLNSFLIYYIQQTLLISDVLVVSAPDFELSGPGMFCWPGHCAVFGRNRYSTKLSFTLEYNWVPDLEKLSRGDALSCFMLQTPWNCSVVWAATLEHKNRS